MVILVVPIDGGGVCVHPHSTRCTHSMMMMMMMAVHLLPTLPAAMPWQKLAGRLSGGGGGGGSESPMYVVVSM